MSHLAGGGRLDVYGVHIQPGRDQRRPLHSGQSTDPLREPHVTDTRQVAHRRRLDSLIRHLLPAAHRLERRPRRIEVRRGRRRDRQQPHGTRRPVFIESHRFVWRLKPRLHDTTGCQTGCQTGLRNTV